MNDRDRNHDQTSEDAFFDFGDRVAFGEGQAPRTELEETFMRIQNAFRQPVAASAPTRSRKDAIWASVMAAPATAALPASGPATDRSWSRPVPPGREKSKNGRWSFNQFAANATLALLIAIVGFGAWMNFGRINNPGPADPPAVVPGVALQQATPDSIVEPAPTQPGAAITTNCDLTGDIPIVTQLSPGDSPLTQTALYLIQDDPWVSTPRGALTVGCDGEDRIVLAENVVSAWQGPWPGIASFTALPPGVDDLAQQQRGFVDVATGRTLLFGPGGQSEMVSDRFSADGSPWVAGPSVDDPATALLADLRTFEARSFADVIGMPLPGAPLLVSNPADDGTLAIGFARTGSIDARGGVYTSDVEGPDGVLVLGASFDDIDWISSPETLPFISPLAVSPDGSMLAAVSSGEGDTLSSYTFGLIDLSNGEVTAASEAGPYTGTPRILWVEDGASAVYLSGSTLQKLDVAGPGGPTTVFDAGEQLESVRKTWSPNVVVVEERQDHGSDATADQTAQDIVYSVDLATGETQEFAGIDVSGMIGWLPDSGALVMYEWLDTAAELATYAVFDPVSGERIGEIKDAPSFQFEVQSRSIVIGRDSVSISANGHVEVASLGTQHIYLFAVDGDTMSMRQVPSPEGLLSEIALTANVYLSPDGSQLSLTGEGDEGRTRYLIDLTDPDSGWIEIPSSGVGGPGPIGFMPGPTR